MEMNQRSDAAQCQRQTAAAAHQNASRRMRGFFMCMFAAVGTLTSGCTSFPGWAKIVHGDLREGRPFEGLMGAPDETHKKSVIFYVHGMGATREEFDEALKERARKLTGKEWRSAFRATPVQLPHPWYVKGEGLDCAEAKNPCVITEFGTLRASTLDVGGKSITMYSYYWDADADKIQYLYGLSTCEWRTNKDDYCDKAETHFWLTARVIKRRIKNPVVVDGFSDATLYAGGFGALMRASMQAAICHSLKHALGSPPPSGACIASSFTADELTRIRTDLDVSFVAKSLGSRMIFDTLAPFDEISVLEKPGSDHETVEAEKGIELKKAIAASVEEVYLLANQLPLLGLSRIEATDRRTAKVRDDIYCKRIDKDPSCTDVAGLDISEKNAPSFLSFASAVRPRDAKLRVVAFHDVNDLLGFKAARHFTQRALELADFVEVRHQNASVVLWMLNSPSAAHAEEDEHKSAANMIWCGGIAKPGGKLRADRCLN